MEYNLWNNDKTIGFLPCGNFTSTFPCLYLLPYSTRERKNNQVLVLKERAHFCAFGYITQGEFLRVAPIPTPITSLNLDKE